jgi:hypothetical protein
MTKKRPSFEEEMQALDSQRIAALEQGDYRAYTFLCDQLGLTPEDEVAYERGRMESQMERQGELEEPLVDAGGLEEVVGKSTIPIIDDSKFTQVTRSYVSGNCLRGIGNLKTGDAETYSDWIASAFLDFSEGHKGYGVRVESSSGINSGVRRQLSFSARFLEKMVGRGIYKTEFVTGFEEDHDDMDKTQPKDYQIEQLESLRALVSKKLPNANVVVQGDFLYVFKKE